MADPTDYTQLDLQNLSPEEAAKLARAQQAALAAQQKHALLGMLGTVPELQEAGKAEYLQGGRERGRGQETAANVLKLSLEKVSQERQLAALQQQIAYQNAQLKLMGAQFGESVRQHGQENARQNYEAYLRGLHTVPGSLVEREGKTAGELANIENITEEASKIPVLGALAKPIGKVLGAGKKAELAATAEEKRKGGYRTEAPMSFEEFVRGGGVAPQPAAPVAAPAASARVKGIYNGQVKYVDPGRVEEAKSHGWRPAP
jgi:hypothetical protein